MRIKLFCTLLILAISQFSYSQNVEKLKLTRSDLPGMEQTRWDVYNENSLWGYINGGADLYFEYGFVEMSAQDFVWHSEPFKIDAYLMTGPKSAFGIYSVSKFKCRKSGQVANWDCINPFQVQVAHGNLYLSIVAYNGTDRSMELATQIAEKVIKKHKANTFILPAFFPSNSFDVNTSAVKLITGQLAMQNSYVALESAFSGLANYELWIVPFSFELVQGELLVANFQNEDDCNKAVSSISSMENNQFHVLNGGNQLIGFTGINPDKNSELINKIQEHILGLNQ